MTVAARRIKVLFVDDDPAALARIERISNENKDLWDVRFATNGHAALAELEFHGSADVVVTDLNMPMMDGTTLLAAVRTQYPSTVRIIVSDFADVSNALRSIPVAHQFLSTPLNAAELADAIERTVEIQQRIVQAPMRASLGSVDLLPSPPRSVIELNRVLSHSDASARDISSIIEHDPAMTAKLLQLVNSSFFALGHRVTNTQQAVAYLGLATVRNLLIAVELVRAFSPALPELGQAAEDVHNHSLAVAELASSLVHDPKHSHDAYAAGMMHDVGLLAMMSKYPERYMELRDAVRNGETLEECEVPILGARHSDIGAYLLGVWGLPHSLVEAVARSHDADMMNDRKMSPLHAVFVAEQVESMVRSCDGTWESSRLPNSEYLNSLGIVERVSFLVSQSTSN